MKVLLINSVCGYGSTGGIVVDLYHKLEKQGYDCCIAYGRGKAPEGIGTIKIGNKMDFCFHALLTRLFDMHGFCSKLVTRRFIQQIKEYDPDIIHLHNIHGYYINIEILFRYLKEANKPVIWTLHDCWSFTGHCAHFDTIGCEKWKEHCQCCPLKKDYPQTMMMDLSYRNYRRKKAIFSGVENMVIVTPSRWLAQKVKESFLKEYPVEVIPNGINTEVFHPIEKDQIVHVKKILSDKYFIDFSKKILLGVASIWTKDKGLEDFIKLSEIIPANTQLVMVGVNKKQKKNLPSNIIGIMRTENQKELAALYACADVFLNPTYADTFPTVNMEAMASGIPVLTYNTGGSVETANVIVDKGDYMEMGHRALESIIINEKNVMYVGPIEKENCLKRYLQVYEMLANTGEKT